jgi:F-type H+-transporting ATPase subunit epsilon
VPAPHLTVSVISAERTIYEGTADMVVVPAWDGEVGVLRGHAPMLVLLGEGELRIKQAGAEQRFMVGGGFMQVVDDVVTVISERAEAG